MSAAISMPACRRLLLLGGNPIRTRSNLSFQSKMNLSFSTRSAGESRSWAFPAIGGTLLATGAGGLVYALNESAKASDLELHSPSYPWPHSGPLSALDTASVRRGWQVYKQVCAACHSLQYVAYREMVDVFLTDEEARAEAAEIQVQDGPDETGKMYMRAGKLSDKVPSPYPNEEAARHANNGALPPDLSYIVLARHGGEDYVFSLLTGYVDPPAGVAVADGQYFNPYFPGGAISMARALYNETVTYDDGTPATASQLAKDVCNFLVWTCQPENDRKKKAAIKVMIVLGFMIGVSWYWKRFVWASVKSRKIIYNDTKSPPSLK